MSESEESNRRFAQRLTRAGLSEGDVARALQLDRLALRELLLEPLEPLEPLRCIIAGGRDATRPRVVFDAMAACPFTDSISVVLSGGATGIDTFGEMWATLYEIPVERYPVPKDEWKRLGLAAGPLRNRRMVENADALVAIPTGGKGTKDVINQAEKAGLKVFIYPYPVQDLTPKPSK